jgi:hypothetical protein
MPYTQLCSVHLYRYFALLQAVSCKLFPANAFLQVRDHVVRPRIEELLRLLPHFRLGIFSSATTRTVNTALGVIHRRLKDIARAKGLGQ